MDYSKAYNSCSHNSIASSLCSLNVSKEMVLLLCNYLSNRKVCVQWNGTYSNCYDLKAGFGQGTVAAPMLFALTNFNLGSTIRGAANVKVMNYVDDSLFNEIIDLSTCATRSLTEESYIIDPDLIESPRALAALLKYSRDRGMRLNNEKNAVITFSNTKIPVRISLKAPESNVTLKQFDNLTLLGMEIDSKLTFELFILKKYNAALRSLWMLRKLRDCNASIDQLRLIYTMYIRSKMEYAIVPVFNLITQERFGWLVSIEKYALSIILNDYVSSYEQKLMRVGLPSFMQRCKTLLRNFAIKSVDSPRLSDYFVENIPNFNLRHTERFQLPQFHTERFLKSPIVSLIRILNES